MPKPFTLLQLSDCHFLDDAAGLYRGHNPDQSLQSLLPSCRRLAADAVVWSGDLSETGSAASYQRLLEMVVDLAPQQAWLPGNHDDASVMQAVFSQAGWQSGPVLLWGGWRVVLLDSASATDPCGQLSDKRLLPLRELQAKSEGDQSPMLVFIHHQPVPVGAAWIDRYGFSDATPLWSALSGLPVKAIGFGHVHQTFVGQHQGVACYSAPSTVANSQAETADFVADPTGPKGRWYRLWPDGRWLSGLISVG